MFPRRISLLAVLFVLAAPAAAEVFERDFVPGSGDGLLTYDNVNGREWLDVTVFAGQWSSEAAFTAAQTNPDFDFADEFPSLGPGGIYESFTLASVDDVTALAVSAGIDPTTVQFNDFPINDIPTSRLIDRLGTTFDALSNGGRHSRGFLSEFDAQGIHHWRNVAKFMHEPSVVSGWGQAGLVILYDGDFILPEFTGLMLYRHVIPEPGGSVLLAIGVVALFGSLRHSNRQRPAGPRETRIEEEQSTGAR